MDFFISNFVSNITSNYATFSGRASRKEYWLFVLAITLVYVGLLMIGMLLKSEVFMFIPAVFMLAMLIPSYAAAARRMHDTDHSGWWHLVPIVNLVFACTKGTTGNNRFGADPLVNQQ